MDFPAELFKLGNKALKRRRVEAAIAFLCLYMTATFVELAGNVGDGHRLLYWLCTVVAVSTGAIGLGGLGLYVCRMPWRAQVHRAGS